MQSIQSVEDMTKTLPLLKDCGNELYKVKKNGAAICQLLVRCAGGQTSIPRGTKT